MRHQIFLIALTSIALAGCGNGVATPETLRGTWSDACPTGELQIEENEIHILYPRKKDYDLSAAVFDGKNLSLSFVNDDGKKVTSVYVYDGKSLALDHSILATGTFSGDKTPMTKCE